MEFFLDHWRLAAVAALFFLGVMARRAGWAGHAHGRWLLNFVFYVGLPVLIFGALTGATLEREHALLPAIALCTTLLCWVAGAFLARRFRLPRKSEGAMSLCAMSMNVAMIYPFASLSFSTVAFSQLVMFDMGHAIMAWTFTTVIACRYGGHADDIPVLLKRALAAPPLWVLFAALALNAGGAPISRDLLHEFLVAGQLMVLLVPLAMGLLVSAQGMRRPEVVASVVLRSVLGGSVGLTLGLLFGLEGTAAGVAALGAAAPVGFTAVVLSAREGLDLELAASAAAISVFLGSLWIPLAVTFV
ncbi:MAG TPA: AEC family transporter [Steroidobacteraceae bacterium]|nr:AEC family transporter [Steroidobacteraceae bacterium]